MNSGVFSRVSNSSVPRGLPRCLLLVALFLGAQVLFLQSSIFRVHDVYVSGNRHLKTKSVLAQLNIPPDQPLWGLNPKQMAQKLVETRQIYQATVTLGLPGRVDITIQERVPVLQVSAKSQRLKWFAVDKEGIFLYALPQGSTTLPRLLVEQQVNLNSRLHPKTLQDLGRAIAAIESKMPHRVWYYSLDSSGNLALRTFSHRHPFDVKLGEFSRLDYKVRLLGALQAQIPKTLVPLSIDLRYNSPIVRFLKPPHPIPTAANATAAAGTGTPGAVATPAAATSSGTGH